MVKTPPSNTGGENLERILFIALSEKDFTSSIPGPGVKIVHASRPKKQKLKQNQYCNKFKRL